MGIELNSVFRGRVLLWVLDYTPQYTLQQTPENTGHEKSLDNTKLMKYSGYGSTTEKKYSQQVNEQQERYISLQQTNINNLRITDKNYSQQVEQQERYISLQQANIGDLRKKVQKTSVQLSGGKKRKVSGGKKKKSCCGGGGRGEVSGCLQCTF